MEDFLLKLVKNLNCLIGITNNNNLLILKFSKFKAILPIIEKPRMLLNFQNFYGAQWDRFSRIGDLETEKSRRD